ncbi:MAG: hypothetical protein HY738_12515 [Bacteroidia bacterium]|nr:hypothetical protein [Bacteroidia bacterium]
MQKAIIFNVIFLIFFLNIQAQNTNITARLTIYKGGNADVFYFNSMNKYKTGITLDDYTRFAIYWRDDSGLPDPDPPSAPHNWELRVLASANQINGDLAGNTLPLETVRLLAQDGGGTTPLGPFCQPEDHLQTPPAELVLVTGAPQGDSNANRIDITYKVGTFLVPGPDYNRILGTNNTPDHYTIDLIFTLTEENF